MRKRTAPSQVPRARIEAWLPARATVLAALMALSLSWAAQRVRAEQPAAPGAAMPGAAPTPAAAGGPLPAAGTVTTPTGLREALAGRLRDAQALLAERNFAGALSQLSLADAVPAKSPLETYYLERLRAAAASGAGDIGQQVRALEAVLASGQTPRADEPVLIEALAAAHYNLKHYAEAARWAGRYLAQGGQLVEMRDLQAQALYLAGDFQGTVSALLEWQRLHQAAGRPVPEAQLDMLAASYLKLQDDAGYLRVLEQLLRSYPRADYWADLLVRLERRPGFSPRLVIDLFRLQFAANALLEPGDYLELAQLAVQAGHPAEARKVLDAGYAANALGRNEDADRHARYRQQVGERALAERSRIEAGTQVPAIAGSADEVFKLGYSLASQGRLEAGLGIMQKALDSGVLARPDEARLRLAATLAQAGQRARAAAVLQAVPAGTDGAADLARLWLILLQN